MSGSKLAMVAMALFSAAAVSTSRGNADGREAFCYPVAGFYVFFTEKGGPALQIFYRTKQSASPPVPDGPGRDPAVQNASVGAGDIDLVEDHVRDRPCFIPHGQKTRAVLFVPPKMFEGVRKDIDDARRGYEYFRKHPSQKITGKRSASLFVLLF